MSKSKDQNNLCEKEKKQQSASGKMPETVEVKWNYFFNTMLMVVNICQVCLMYNRKLVSAENAMKLIDTQIEDWINRL